ncbi:MAG: ABC-2 transporter permease [Clostridiales bacterium]|nr:ABC-2 transporter permease [Clostridiales bacterium]
MKYLLLLDGYTMLKKMKTYLFLILTYIVLAIIASDWEGPSVFGILAFLLLALIPNTLMQHYELERCEQLSLLLPDSRKLVVQERYLTVLILLGIAALLFLPLSFLSGEDYWFFAFLSFCPGCVFLAILLPLNFRLGPQRAKGILIAITVLFMLGCLVGTGFLLSSDDLFLDVELDWLFDGSRVISAAGLAVSLGLLGLSYPLSLRFYERREF